MISTEREWTELVQKLEEMTRGLDGERMRAQDLKRRAEEALAAVESDDLLRDKEVAQRLDFLVMHLTELAKENVCTNTKCPHYYGKCRMR